MNKLTENYRRFFAGRGVNAGGTFNDSKLIKEFDDESMKAYGDATKKAYGDDSGDPKTGDDDWYGDDDQFDDSRTVSGLSKDDYIGSSEMLGDLVSEVEEYHRHTLGPIQDAAAETDDPQYDMQEKQVSRYFQTIFKSIENLQKFLQKQSRRA